MAPTCSVVIPVRNMDRFLSEAVESVLAQKGCSPEIVIVDDGSSDASVDVARRYASDRVKVLSEGIQGGAGATRNRGFRESRGETVVFLDADDRMRPGALARFLGPLERDPELGVVYGEVMIVNAEGKPIGPGKPTTYRRRPSGDVLLRMLRGPPIVAPGAACIRRELLEQAGLFGGFVVGEDWELYFRLALRGRFSYLRGEPVLDYRRHPASVTATVAERFESARPAIDAIFSNPELRTRLPGWLIAQQRRRAVAGSFGHAGRTALRNGNFDLARRNLFECLRRDPYRPREIVLLIAALLGRLPGPLRRRIK